MNVNVNIDVDVDVDGNIHTCKYTFAMAFAINQNSFSCKVRAVSGFPYGVQYVRMHAINENGLPPAGTMHDLGLAGGTTAGPQRST